MTNNLADDLTWLANEQHASKLSIQSTSIRPHSLKTSAWYQAYTYICPHSLVLSAMISTMLIVATSPYPLLDSIDVLVKINSMASKCTRPKQQLWLSDACLRFAHLIKLKLVGKALCCILFAADCWTVKVEQDECLMISHNASPLAINSLKLLSREAVSIESFAHSSHNGLKKGGKCSEQAWSCYMLEGKTLACPRRLCGYHWVWCTTSARW